MVQQIYRLSLLGLTLKQMATALGESYNTLVKWTETDQRVKQAIRKGADLADSEVVDALFKRAIGYEHDSVKFFKTTVEEEEKDEEGNVVSTRKYTKIIKMPFVQKFPPDVRAAVKILGVRHRENWGEAYKVEHQHSHMHVQGMGIHSVLGQISDMKNYSDAELEIIAKLGLQNAAGIDPSQN